jgi:hypothetical protein
MYSGTVASYRHGRTIRGHYPYVAARQSIWTGRRKCRLSPFLICAKRVVPPKQASAGSTELVSQIARRELESGFGADHSRAVVVRPAERPGSRLR